MPAATEPGSDMQFVVAGPGYTGQRVLQRLPPERCTRLGRPAFDLDSATVAWPALTRPCTLLYTIPPPGYGTTDERMARLLSLPGLAPARFVYLSTTGVYGDRDGQRVDESAEPAPATPRAARRLDAERRLQGWCDARDVALFILRVPGIYGPGRLGLERIARSRPVIAEAEAAPGNRIHVDDLAACCVLAMTGDTPPGIYNVGDGDHSSSTAFTKTVASLAGLPLPPEVSRAEAEATFEPARLSFLAESRIVATTRMREILGFTPRYANVEDGIRASLDD
jgi:nucleoside-diphosphate-sugar epimerase